MKIILSRKGTDSAAGGIPSIILPNNKIVHIPIPGNDYENIAYEDIKYNDDIGILADLMSSLTTNIQDGKYKKLFTKEQKCHLDPDINELVYPRQNNWRGCFGQMGQLKQF